MWLLSCDVTPTITVDFGNSEFGGAGSVSMISIRSRILNSRQRKSGKSEFRAFVKCLGVIEVTIDKSLRRKGRLVRARNVLTRTERIERLKYDDTWQEGQSPLGLPKVRIIKTVVGKKKKKKTKEEDDAAATDASADT